MRYIGLIFLAGVFFTQYAVACSCVPWDARALESLDEGAEMVFIGTLKKIRRFRSFTANSYQFDDLEVYKGDMKEKVNVWSQKLWPFPCGLQLDKHDKNERFVVFAHRDGKRLWAGSCSAWGIYHEEATEPFRRFYRRDSNDSARSGSMKSEDFWRTAENGAQA